MGDVKTGQMLALLTPKSSSSGLKGRFGLGEDVLTQQLLGSVTIFRWVTLVWAGVGVVLSRDDLAHPWIAIALLGVAGSFTAFTSYLASRKQAWLPSTWLLGIEITIGIGLLLGDGYVYEPTRLQSLPWAWPAAGIMTAAICLGKRAGAASAILVGLVSMFTELQVLDRSILVSAFSKIGLWLLVGVIAGALTQRLQAAEREISLARTREEVARELHDGVLQTLAVIQRRSEDPDLSAMAKDQENSLRRYLADSRVTQLSSIALGAANSAGQPQNLEASLRGVAAQAEKLHRLAVQVIVTPDCPDAPAIPEPVLQALAGAVSEALTNAAKHGEASKATVFAEPTDPEFDDNHRGYGLFVSVKDNGFGFRVEKMVEGIGLGRSIRGRIEERGGVVELQSRPGRGTEIQIWV